MNRSKVLIGCAVVAVFAAAVAYAYERGMAAGMKRIMRIEDRERRERWMEKGAQAEACAQYARTVEGDG